MAFIVINICTSILPNEYLVSTLPFYVLNILPILAADILLTKLSADSGKHNSSNGKEKEIGEVSGRSNPRFNIFHNVFSLNYPHI